MLCFGKKSSATDTSRKPPQEVSHRVPAPVAMPDTRSAPLTIEKDRFNSDSVDIFLQQEKQIEEGKIKLLLLGTGESGKSTIFKQFRILYGAPKTDDDLRMYGIVVRSNIISAISKICELARDLGFEPRLERESNIANDGLPEDACGMTVKDAYDQIVSHLVDNNATSPLPDISPDRIKSDWLGKSPRAGAKANSDAIRCLQLADAIETLWQVGFKFIIQIT